MNQLWAETDDYDAQMMAMIGGNALLPISTPYMPHIEVLATKITDCESGSDHQICEKGGYCDNGLAYGIAQFHEPTFDWMAGEAGIENPDWKSQHQQEYLLRWALTNKLGSHWTCLKLVI